MTEFVWEDCDIFVPHKPQFDDSDVGVASMFLYTGEDMTEMEYFRAYFDEQFMQHLVAETNRYAGQLIEAGILQASRMIRWKDTTVAELYVFFALCMLQKHSEKQVIQDYWNKEAAVPSPVFNKYMSRDRFLLLLRCLHFENLENFDRNDRFWRVQKVFNDLRGKFRDYFVPGQNVVIDESLVLFKGRLLFKQYIPSKRHRFRLKFFVLCDCETGMVIDMILYSGTDVDIPSEDPLGFSGSVGKTLMEPLLNKGHILYTDNYYTSPLLTKFLHEHNTGVCGTVKTNRKEMPVF
nr:piggyBac transposable element-derived protein 4-like [Procambarus clarkii]